jgi:hypothetical protein
MDRAELIRKCRVGGGKWNDVDCHGDVPGDWGWCVVWAGVGPLVHVRTN